jgi:hypothetical protein
MEEPANGQLMLTITPGMKLAHLLALIRNLPTTWQAYGREDGSIDLIEVQKPPRSGPPATPGGTPRSPAPPNFGAPGLGGVSGRRST